MPCVLIRDFFKYFFTRYQTAPREILRFRQDMNNALVRLLRLRCFKYGLSSILAEVGQGENVHFSAFAMQPNRRLMKVDVAFIQMDNFPEPGAG